MTKRRGKCLQRSSKECEEKFEEKRTKSPDLEEVRWIQARERGWACPVWRQWWC